MRRQTADGALHAVGGFKYGILQSADIDAAAFVDLDKAVVVDAGDDQSDAVEMRVKQQRFCRLRVAELGV